MDLRSNCPDDEESSPGEARDEEWMTPSSSQMPRKAAIVGRMPKRSRIALLLSTLWLVNCGGSQKLPDAAQSQPAPTPSVTQAEPDPAKPEVTAKAKEPEAETASSGPECSKDADCTIFADCCSCKAVPAAKPSPVPCESVCGESKCEVKGITIVNVACDAGRCVIKKNK
jgi:hypothetical protein